MEECIKEINAKKFIYLDLIFGKKKIKDVKKNIMKIKMILN